MRLIDADALNGYQFGLISPQAQKLFHKIINNAPTLVLEQRDIEYCDDCISREDAIRTMCSHCTEWQICNMNCIRKEALENKENLPPVKPKQNT